METFLRGVRDGRLASSWEYFRCFYLRDWSMIELMLVMDLKDMFESFWVSVTLSSSDETLSVAKSVLEAKRNRFWFF